MPSVGLLINPRALRSRRDPALTAELSRRVEAAGGLALEPDGLDALDAAAHLLHVRRTAIVCVYGGDGSVHRAITAMGRAWGDAELPALALLRGGTNNTVARGLGNRDAPLRTLDEVLELGTGIDCVERDLLRVDGEHLGFMFSNGLFVRYLEAYDQGPPSMRRAAWVLTRAVGSALVGGAFARALTAPMQAEVELDGAPWVELPFMTVPAGTVDDIGLGFRAFPRAPITPGHFEVLGIGCSAFQLAFQLPRFYRGRGPDHPAIGVALAQRMLIRSGAPQPWALDGDRYPGGQTITVEIGPRVRLAVPRRARRAR